MREYIFDESAAEDIQVIIFMVIAVTVAVCAGWYIFNTIKGQTAKQKCGSNSGPFCIE